MSGYILVVDDQSSVRYFLREVLKSFGYPSKIAENGYECLTTSRSTDKPSLILLDYQMPHMTGIEVLTALKSDNSTRKIPIIMISAEKDVKEKAIYHGVNAVLTKPIDIAILRDEIHKAFGKAVTK